MKHAIMKYVTGSAAGLLLCLGGCQVGPDYELPVLEMPDQWHQQLVEGMETDTPGPESWWELLNDPLLNDLVQQVRSSNPDLQSAYWNLAAARYGRDYAAGQYYPSVDGVGGYSRSLYSSNGAMGGGFPSKPFELYNLGFDAAWEPDIFGRVSRAVQTAQASYESQIENYRDVLVTLAAEAARNYVELRTLQARIDYARQNIQSQEETLNLVQARFDAEIAPRLDVEQALLNLADTRSELPLLRSAEQAALNRLSVLTGKNPGELNDLFAENKPIPLPPEVIRIQIPAELLRRRPDVRRAERQLAAQSAQIGIAVAELYPHFSLTGNIGFEATDFSELTDSRSKNYGFGPSFRWRLFDGDRVRNQIRIEESRTEQLYWQYRSTVLMAMEEVENAMTDYVQMRLRQEDLAASVRAATESVRLATDQYKNGLTDFQSILVLQRSLFLQQDKLAQTRGQVVQSLIRLYKALGGWCEDVLPETDIEKTTEPNNQTL